MQADVRFVRELLEHGANVHAVDTKGRTALHHAVALEKRVIVDLLLIFGANTNRYHVYVHDLSRAHAQCVFASPPFITSQKRLRRQKTHPAESQQV